MNQANPTWGEAVYDGLNLFVNIGAMGAKVPLKLGIGDGLGRPTSIFDVTVSRFNNPTLVSFLNLPLPNGTTQTIFLFGIGQKSAVLIDDIVKVEKK